MLRDPVWRARGAALLGLVACTVAAVGLWPGVGAPAWPAAALGLAAVALALEPGPIGARATATLLGSAAALTGWAQIGALWGAASAL